MKHPVFTYLFIAFLVGSCKTITPLQEVVIEDQLLDTLTVVATKVIPETFKTKPYNASKERIVDLKHMDLDISFDWEKEHVFGEAILTLSPYFYPLSTIELDAVQMTFDKIMLDGKKALKYEYTDEKLVIDLGREYSKDETLKIHIKYVAMPSLGKNPSEPVSDDQGLYFINPDGSDQEKPSQIWSQGETEYNSHWFPTNDAPNERYTHDIKITVADKYATLSNGYLVSSNKYAADTRTDHWKMNDEHPPYLTMITVGKFSVIKDQWEGKPLLYYVEKEYEAYAKNIFNHTPELLTFFSELTGVPYPWDQYAQVVIRDFVAGAMENTTAVTFGEFVQKTERELIDNSNDDIVAHEMFHHWFGDYVTCESWANLTLNEGFANYSEYLWTEHKYGEDAAGNKRWNELQGYLRSAKMQGIHPLIHYSYDDKEDMFDAHSYNKGGLVLHMLRNKVGDKAFFASLKKYLTDNAGTAVEVDELRMAFEDITGKDLNPFFDQWYLSSGHPELEINYSTDSSRLIIDVKQIQNPEQSPAIFQLDLAWDIYQTNGQKMEFHSSMTERKQQYTIDLKGQVIDWVNFDPKHILLGTWTENKTNEDYIKELLTSQSQYDQREALTALRDETVDYQIYKDIFRSDRHYINRWVAMNRFQYDSSEKELYHSVLKTAPNVFFKGRILNKFTKNPNDISEQQLIEILEIDRSWAVISPALYILSLKNPSKMDDYFQKYKLENNTQLIFTLSEIQANEGNIEGLDYIFAKIPYLHNSAITNYSDFVVAILDTSNEEDFKIALNKINTLVFDSPSVDPSKKISLANQLKKYFGGLDEEKKKMFSEPLNEWEVTNAEVRDLFK